MAESMATSMLKYSQRAERPVRYRPAGARRSHSDEIMLRVSACCMG